MGRHGVSGADCFMIIIRAFLKTGVEKEQGKRAELNHEALPKEI